MNWLCGGNWRKASGSSGALALPFTGSVGRPSPPSSELSSAAGSLTTVPLFGPAIITKSSTALRAEGHHFNAQRGTATPWLWPITATCRPVSARIRRSACTTYSAEIC